MIEVEGFIAIEPKAKGRPRMNTMTGKAYTPKETRQYENILKLELYQRYRYDKCVSLGKPVMVDLIFHLPQLKKPKKYATGKPDLDNLVKAFTDAAEKILWANDSQIVRISAMKCHSVKCGVWYSVKPSGEDLQERGRDHDRT